MATGGIAQHYEADESHSFTSSLNADSEDSGARNSQPTLRSDQVNAEEGNNDVDEDELSPLEYAHYHELTTDYIYKDPLRDLDLSALTNDLDADVEATELAFQKKALLCRHAFHRQASYDKWEVDKASAKYLASIVSLGQCDNPEYEVNIDSEANFRDPKLEEPLLRTDPELDLLRLKRRSTIRLSTRGTVPFPIDVEKCEGYRWTPKELSLPAEKVSQVAHGRLDIDRDTMEFLKEISNAPNPRAEDFEQMLLSERTLRLPSPETPPLLPLSSPLKLGGISDVAAEMELTSTPEDLTPFEAANMAQEIAERDNTATTMNTETWRLECAAASIASIYSPLRDMDESPSSPLPPKRLQDLKMDVPLTPLESARPPAKKPKMISFPDDVHSIIPEPESDSSLLDAAYTEHDMDSVIINTLQPLARSAMEKLDNEQLLEFETTMRVRVPQVEKVRLVPPWEQFIRGERDGAAVSEQQNASLAQTKNELLDGQMKWSGVSKIERLLPWSPFPARLGKVELRETLDDGSLASYLAELRVEDDIDVATLISEPAAPVYVDGIDDKLLPERVVFDDGHEPELEPHHSTPSLQRSEKDSPLPAVAIGKESTELSTARMDMQTLLRKRKEELEAVDKSTRSGNQAGSAENEGVQHSKAENQVVAKPTRFGDLANSAFTISRFLQVYGDLSTAGLHVNPPSQEQRYAAPPAIMLPQQGREIAQIKEPRISLPAPVLQLHPKAYSVVVSSSMLAHRNLVRKLQTALPSLELVERDTIPSNVTTATKQQSKDYDADITVSPLSGILVTTLQKLKQKPLPGQSTFFGVHERIAAVSTRYNNLIVLVSESRQPGAPECVLDERDTEALSDLMGFSTTLENDVSIFYVYGSDSELATWIASVTSHYSISDDSTALLNDETLWERFLRTAGFNSCAAQNILAQLKLPGATQGVDSSSPPVGPRSIAHGLAAFVLMTTKQRNERFGEIVGGSLLQRMNDVVKSPWTATCGEST